MLLGLQHRGPEDTQAAGLLLFKTALALVAETPSIQMEDGLDRFHLCQSPEAPEATGGAVYEVVPAEVQSSLRRQHPLLSLGQSQLAAAMAHQMGKVAQDPAVR